VLPDLVPRQDRALFLVSHATVPAVDIGTAPYAPDHGSSQSAGEPYREGSSLYVRDRGLAHRAGAVQAITGVVRGVMIEIRYAPLTGKFLTAFPR
jgi:hypothetical protein